MDPGARGFTRESVLSIFLPIAGVRCELVQLNAFAIRGICRESLSGTVDFEKILVGNRGELDKVVNRVGESHSGSDPFQMFASSSNRS